MIPCHPRPAPGRLLNRLASRPPSAAVAAVLAAVVAAVAGPVSAAPLVAVPARRPPVVAFLPARRPPVLRPAAVVPAPAVVTAPVVAPVRAGAAPPVRALVVVAPVAPVARARARAALVAALGFLVGLRQLLLELEERHLLLGLVLLEDAPCGPGDERGRVGHRGAVVGDRRGRLRRLHSAVPDRRHEGSRRRGWIES